MLLRSSAPALGLGLAVAALVTSGCASAPSPREEQSVTIEVLNDLGPSSDVRVDIAPVWDRRRTVLLGWVPIGETRTFRHTLKSGRYFLAASGGSRGQTSALTARNPRSTRVRSERFTVDWSTDRIVWSLSTNHLRVQRPDP